MPFKTSPILKRHPGNPIITDQDVPYEAALVFNAGFTKYQGKYVCVFRNDWGLTKENCLLFKEGKVAQRPPNGTNIGLAYSDDGVHWEVQPKPCFAMHSDEIRRAYDPRLTVIDGRVYMCFAIDTNHGVCGGIATTEDFENWEVLTTTAPDNRNMVLFPEKIDDLYVRLERPFPVYSRGGEKFDVWLGKSPDMRYWGDHALVLGAEQVPFCNSKLGPAAPPVKTDKGWLTTFHAVWKSDEVSEESWDGNWKKLYTGGIMLLDLDDPSKVIGMSREPLIAPEPHVDYEWGGFRGRVIFPGGMILEDSGEVKLYYGAADTVEALATAHVDDLLALCEPMR